MKDFFSDSIHPATTQMSILISEVKDSCLRLGFLMLVHRAVEWTEKLRNQNFMSYYTFWLQSSSSQQVLVN